MKTNASDQFQFQSQSRNGVNFNFKTFSSNYSTGVAPSSQNPQRNPPQMGYYVDRPYVPKRPGDASTYVSNRRFVLPVPRRDEFRNGSRNLGPGPSSAAAEVGKYGIHQQQPPLLPHGFGPIIIYVYRNGDEYDKGTEVNVTFKSFKHWIVLLEHLTKKCQMPGPVNFLYSMNGRPVFQFEELIDGGEYVAAIQDFKRVRYGSKVPKDWQHVVRGIAPKDPLPLDSPESIEIYLQKMGYQSKTGKPFPEDYDPTVYREVNGATKGQNVTIPRRSRLAPGSISSSRAASEAGSKDPGSYTIKQRSPVMTDRSQLSNTNRTYSVPPSRTTLKK